MASKARKKGKYHIYDDIRRRVFTVTIADLHFDVAGKYWCGVTKTGKDLYTEAKLDVRQGQGTIGDNKLN
ncbi:hypothetical protein ILYODFUR_036334 [Ilyodon furcidens]|uniref:Uncharacterized protein n=1 Tax=Ilyodon furcidens TaxID=33524 RepID=A0ABV0SUM6_9TELE